MAVGHRHNTVRIAMDGSASIFFGVALGTSLVVRHCRSRARDRASAGRVRIREVKTNNTRAGFWTVIVLCAVLLGSMLVATIGLATLRDVGLLAMAGAGSLHIVLALYRPKVLEVWENGLIWHQFYSWDGMEIVTRRDCHGLAFQYAGADVCIEMSADDATEIVSMVRNRSAQHPTGAQA